MKQVANPLADPPASVITLGGAIPLNAPAHSPIADLAKRRTKAGAQSRAMSDDDRTRLARDVHDGMLQVLAGIGLQLAAASDLIASDADGARARLDAIGKLVAEEQRDLRAFLHRLKPAASAPMMACAELVATLENPRRRAEQLGGLRVGLVVDGEGTVARSMGEDILRIVQEALANITRHARAQSARIVISLRPEHVHIEISDDGCGFSFRGKYDLDALAVRQWGPMSVMDRVAALRGELTLTSSLSGSLLDIVLPVEPRAHRWSGDAEESADPWACFRHK